VIVEENPYQGGWGATVASIVADEGFYDLDAPVKRVAGACVPSRSPPTSNRPSSPPPTGSPPPSVRPSTPGERDRAVLR
jgi:pyruvate/2-oxoglutarate/acetoin dehydrogenase E1 component